MTPERLAQMRVEYDSIECKPSNTVGHIRELLDHIAQLDERIAGLKFANGVLDSAAKDAQSWLYEAQTAKEAYCELLEANRVTEEAGGVIAQLNGMIDELRAQLEAQRGRSMDLTEDALSLACGCELPPVEGVDAIKFGLRSSLRSGYRNGWRDACAKMQRGGAVVVPAWNRSDFDKVPPEWSEMQRFGAGYELAASRIQPIPAGGALADGMVGVDREEWEAANDFALRYGGGWSIRALADFWGRWDALRSANGEATP